MRASSVLFPTLIAALALGACSFEAAPESPAPAASSDAASSAPTSETNASITITSGGERRRSARLRPAG